MEFKLVSKRKCQRAAFFPQAKVCVSDHIRIEKRSIALHRAIADRIRTNPKLMEKARENLQKIPGSVCTGKQSATKVFVGMARYPDQPIPGGCFGVLGIFRRNSRQVETIQPICRNPNPKREMEDL